MSREALAVYRNGACVHVCDRREARARMQFAYVAKMDGILDEGIELDGEFIRRPDEQQRLRYMIGEVVDAVLRNDTRMLDMLGRWLVQRVPRLDAIRIEDAGAELDVRLSFSDEG